MKFPKIPLSALLWTAALGPAVAQEAPVPPIDTTSRQAVVDAYRSYYLASMGTQLVWTGGSYKPTAPGTINEQWRIEALRRLNWYRAMAGLPGNVVFAADLNAKCQAGALMVSAGRDYPGYDSIPTTWPCYTPEGADGCRASNLLVGATSNTFYSVQDGFINEADFAVGHRWWFLRPGFAHSGVGAVPNSADFTVPGGLAVWVTSAGSTPAPAPWVAWPPPGYFPVDPFRPGTNFRENNKAMPSLWSLFLDAADFGTATVAIKKNGQSIPADVTARLPAGGDSGMVWILSQDRGSGNSALGLPGDIYEATVSGIMVGGVERSYSWTVRAFDADASKLINVSTRLRVETGEGVGIAGFVVQGDKPRRVVVRALGPSLSAAGVSDGLANPTLSLRDAANQLVVQNDDWQTQAPGARGAELLPLGQTGFAPSNAREAAVAVALAPGAYTAVVSGASGETGVALVEVYDLDPQSVESRAVNVSTRGRVQTGDNVMIGGFVVAGGTRSRNVVVRALGPSLTAAGVSGALADPMLEVFDARGQRMALVDDFDPATATELGALKPTDSREAAIKLTLVPGAYTAVVRGKGAAAGVALVEAYEVQ